MKNFVSICAANTKPFRVKPVEATCLEDAFRQSGGPNEDFCSVLSEKDAVKLAADLLGAVDMAGFEHQYVLDLFHKMERCKEG